MNEPTPLPLILDRYLAQYQRARWRRALISGLLVLAIAFTLAWHLRLGIAAGVAAGVLGLGALAWGLRRGRISRGQAAEALDRALGLEQRLVTAAECLEGRKTSELYPVLLADVEAKATSPTTSYPKPWSRTSSVLVALLVLLLCWPHQARLPLGLKLPEPPSQPPSTPPPPPPAPDQQQQQQQSPQAGGGSTSNADNAPQNQQPPPSSPPSSGAAGQSPSSGQSQNNQSSSQGQGSQSQSQGQNNQGQSGTQGQGQQGAGQQGAGQQGSGQQQGAEGQQGAEQQSAGQQSGGQQQGATQSASASRSGQQGQGQQGAGQQAGTPQQAGQPQPGQGDQQALKGEIQQLLKEMSGQVKELQGQLSQMEQNPPPPGTDTDPESLFNDNTPLDPLTGAPLPMQLETDTAATKASRKGGGTGKPSGDVGREGPEQQAQDAALSAAPTEQAAVTRQPVPPEYRPVFERLQSTQPTESEPSP